MLDFEVDPKLCTRCGECVADCPMRIIDMGDGVPEIKTGNEEKCIRCQHCLAVCPAAAISIAGYHPAGSAAVTGDLPDAVRMETLIKERRSIRQYKKEDLPPELLQRLLGAVRYAPTGKNMQQVRLTVVDGRQKLARLREELMAGLGRLVRGGKLPAGMEFVADLVRIWEEKHVDILFRDAPHLLIASGPKTNVSPLADCFIALTTFDLFARTLGVGTLWCGLAKVAISDVAPEFRRSLGIPEDHVVGYAMTFGWPAVQYARTVQRAPAVIHRVD